MHQNAPFWGNFPKISRGRPPGPPPAGGGDPSPTLPALSALHASVKHSASDLFVLQQFSIVLQRKKSWTPLMHGFEWNVAGMLYHKSRSACGEIIHVRQILPELWSLTLRIITHFSLSSQLLLHPCMDLNETWQGCCTTSLEVHVGNQILQELRLLKCLPYNFFCLYEISP